MKKVWLIFIMVLATVQAQAANDLVSGALSDFLGGDTANVMTTEEVAALEPGVLTFEPTAEGRSKAAAAFYEGFGRTEADADPILKFIGNDLDLNELQAWVDTVSPGIGFKINNIADVSAFKTIYSYITYTGEGTTPESDVAIKNFFSSVYAGQSVSAEERQIQTQKDLMEVFLLSYYLDLQNKQDPNAPTSETIETFAVSLMKSEGFDPAVFAIGEKGIVWGGLDGGILGERVPNPNGTGDTDNLLAGKMMVSTDGATTIHFCPDGSSLFGISGEVATTMALGSWQLEADSTEDKILFSSLLDEGKTEPGQLTRQGDGTYQAGSNYNSAIFVLEPSSQCPLGETAAPLETSTQTAETAPANSPDAPGTTETEMPTAETPTAETPTAEIPAAETPVPLPESEAVEPKAAGEAFGGLFGSTADPLTRLSGQQFVSVAGDQMVHFCADNSLILEANGAVFGRGSWALAPDSTADALGVTLSLTEQDGATLATPNEVGATFSSDGAGGFSSAELGSSYTVSPSTSCTN